MRGTLQMTGLREALKDGLRQFDKAVIAGMGEVAEGMKEDLADDTFKVLGERMSRTWRSKLYANADSTKSGPAAFVYSKAPQILSFFTADRVVTALGGRFLAIPTDDTPKKAGGGRMSVEEVQAKYGKRLQFVSPSDRGFKTPSARRGGVAFLVLKDLVVRKATQRYRNASAREKASKRRPLQAVIMFILVPQVRGRKRLDLKATLDRWAAKAPGLIELKMETGA